MAAESPPRTNADTDAPNPLVCFQPDRSRHRLGALLHGYALMGRVSLRLGSQSLHVPLPSPALGTMVVFLRLSCRQAQRAHRSAWAGRGSRVASFMGKVSASCSPGEPDTGLELGQYLAAPGSSLTAPG